MDAWVIVYTAELAAPGLKSATATLAAAGGK
jgi:hypothetical protein